jgi:hypothetical protein
VEGHRLEEALPYFVVGPEGLALILCRWQTESPIPVWLPPNASEEQAAVLARALAAWEGAGIGVRFAPRAWTTEPPVAGLVIEIVAPEETASAAANTIADCAIPQQVGADPGVGETVAAQIRYASIHLTAVRPDLLGRGIPLSSAELLGAAVHELGHALGFAGHVARGGSLMSSHGQVDAVRRWGRRLEAGEPLDAPNLAALYAAPSGVRVGWLPLSRAQIDPIRAVSAAATRAGLRGPFARVGEASARILWRDVRDRSAAVVVFDWPAVVVEPGLLEPRPNRLARLLVERGSGP